MEVCFYINDSLGVVKGVLETDDEIPRFFFSKKQLEEYVYMLVQKEVIEPENAAKLLQRIDHSNIPSLSVTKTYQVIHEFITKKYSTVKG